MLSALPPHPHNRPGMQERIVTPSQELQKLFPQVADKQMFWLVICAKNLEISKDLSFFFGGVSMSWNFADDPLKPA